MFKKLIQEAIKPLLDSMLEAILKAIKNINIDSSIITEPPIVEQPTTNNPATGEPKNQVKRLGVNFTWQQIQQINGQRKGEEAYRNYTPEMLNWVDDARFFVFVSKDFEDGFPTLCDDMTRIWECPDGTIAKNVEAIINLRRLMPNATIWLTFESPDQGSWPLKMFPASWWGDNPRGKSKRYFKLYLEAIKLIGGQFTLQATNEESPHEDDPRVQTYDLVRMGLVDAHKEFVKEGGTNVKLSTGSRTYSNREWRINGVKKPISESIKDLQPEYLQYINDTNGYSDFHLYPETDDQNYYIDSSLLNSHPDVQDLKEFVSWLKENYPNITPIIGETTNLEAKHKTVLSTEDKIKSFDRLKEHLDYNYNIVNTQIIYQIENHGEVEGKFTDSGILPWIDKLKEYKKNLNTF